LSVHTLCTAEELRHHMRYSPDTGVFVWVNPVTNAIKAGDVAGAYDLHGYRNISFLGKKYKAHRLAWLYVYGEWPPSHIDHINGQRGDNRLCNLRASTRSQNQANQGLRANNRTGFKGISLNRQTNRWFARIKHKNKTKYLGHFDTPEEAHAAYAVMARHLNGEFARVA
jgi:hypothetical protein